MIDYVRFHFLDASALVKLLLHPDIKELGSDTLAAYRRKHSNFGTITLCITEALSVIKSKHFGSNKNRSLSLDGYLIVANRLRTMLEHETVRAHEFDLSYCQMLCMALGGVPIFFYSIDEFNSFDYLCQLL